MKYTRGKHPNSRIGGFKKGHTPKNKGKKIGPHSKTHIKNRSKGMEKAHSNKLFGYKKGHKVNLGHKFSELSKKKMSKSNPKIWKGQTPWNYIDGRSKDCSPARYGDDWFKIRLLVYKRDNYNCQECGLKMSKETGAFHIHHKVPFLISFDNSLNNLETLCPSCHRKIEAQIMIQFKGGERNYE